MSCKPVLFIIWRRKEKALQSLEKIRGAEPRRLYIASDGFPNDKPEIWSDIRECRDLILQEIDWQCELRLCFSEEHKGCGRGVSDAITWFFENEREGVIVEDDCVLSSSFFRFASELLDAYKDDKRVWSICADNRMIDNSSVEADFYFSRYSYCWGWATWSDRWQDYSYGREKWDTLRCSGGLSQLFECKRERKYWQKIFEDLFDQGTPDTWDYQWLLTIWVNNGMNIVPKWRMVQNVGFDHDSTNLSGFGSQIVSSKRIVENRLSECIVVPELSMIDRFNERKTTSVVFGLTRRFGRRWLVRKWNGLRRRLRR